MQVADARKRDQPADLYPYADRCQDCGLAMPIAFTAPPEALIHLYHHCPGCSADTPIIPRNRRTA